MARFVTFIALLVSGLSLSSLASAQTVTKIVNNGSDAQRLVFVVMGDGYSATTADKAKFAADVNTLIVNGVLGHDFYAQNKTAFNVYRVDLVSQDSGVSTPGSPKNTALKTIYNGNQAQCWISDAPSTAALIAGAAPTVTRVDFYVVIPNATGYGGCTRGNVLYITSGSPYTVASHEYGHGIGYLFDEYSSGFGTFRGTYHYLNCSSIETTRASIQWASKIASATAVPTTFLPGMNDNTSVGAFNGCYYFDSGLYRPVQNCRMRVVDTVHLFCPICRQVMDTNTRPHLPPAPQTPSPPQNFRVTPTAFFQAPRGNQQPAAEPAYVNLQLQVFSDGRIQILRAVQGSGSVVSANAVADTLYEITQNGRVIAAGPLAPGLLRERGYGRPGAETAHADAPATSSTVSITIPNTTLNALLSNTSISLNQVAAGVALQPVTPAWVTELRSGNYLRQRAAVSAQTLGAQLRPFLPANRGR